MESSTTGKWDTMAELDEDLVRSLAAFRAERGLCISLFLNLDPQVVPTPGQVDSHVGSLVTAARDAVRDLSDMVEHDRVQGALRDVERIEAFLQEELDRAGAHAVALFVSGLDFVWHEVRLSSPVEDSVRVARTFALSPLLASLERDRELLLVAVGRDRGTLWRSRSGRTRQLADMSRHGQGRHDQGGWSQARYQRSREREALDHLRVVADAIGDTIPQGSETLLVAAVAEEQRPAFEGLLPPHLHEALLGWAVIEAHAGDEALQPEAERLLDERLEDERQEILERWREERAGGRAAGSWEAAIAAAQDGQVDTAVVDGRTEDAWECPSCGRGNAAAGTCEIDSTPLEAAPGGALELVVRGTFAHGGTVRLGTAEELRDTPGVAALLRYKPSA